MSDSVPHAVDLAPSVSAQLTDAAAETDSFDRVDAGRDRPSQLLSVAELQHLNTRSDLKGAMQLAGHLLIMAASGGLWAWGLQALGQRWWVAVPALVVYGFSFASMFATTHECVHRTAFATAAVNDAVAWFAGLLSGYNSTFYRRYHKWHHRYTQIPGKDPELGDPKPTTLWEYGLEIIGWNWWLGKLQGHTRIALGRLEDCPYVPESARAEVIRSTRLQLLVYGVAIALSIASQYPWFVLYWLLPLAVGQPILRFILLAEHGGCSYDANPLTNTRTTLTLWPLRFLMWNMPFHAEHHLYTAIPFHALPATHEKIAAHLAHLDQGYVAVNQQFIRELGRSPA